jgi:hypothetical protein
MAFTDAINWFGEWFTAMLTVKPALLYAQSNSGASHRGIAKADEPVIVDRRRRLGAFGADLKGRVLLGFDQTGGGFIFLPGGEFQFRKQNKSC